MDFKEIELKLLAPTLILIVYFCTCHCHPVGIQQYTTTPKVFNDRFVLNKQVRPIASNGSSNVNGQHALKPGLNGMVEPQNKVEVENSNSFDKVKAVNLGEKTMRQNDDDDDDDDDGGEYTGLDGSCSSGSKTQKDSVPLMIIRQLDMLALDIPVRDKDNNGKGKEPKVSPSSSIINSKDGMDSFQARWRLQPKALFKAPSAAQERGQKMSPTHSRNANSDNAFGISGRRDMDYDFGIMAGKEDMENGIRSMGEKRDMPYAVGGRKDLDYGVGGNKEPPYEARPGPQGCRYFY